MNKVLDTCYIKDQLIKKNYSAFVGSYIMRFQKFELTEDQLMVYTSIGGKILVGYNDLHLKGDDNFYLLDNSKYFILTYDKELKRELKKRGYLVK